MKRSNTSFLLGWFMVGFAIAYILLNSSKWANSESTEISSTSTDDNKFEFIESRNNINSTNYVRLPSFRSVNKSSFGTQKPVNYAQNTENEGHITANYEVIADKKNTMGVSQSNIAGGIYVEPAFNHVISKETERKDNYSNNNKYSELTQSSNKIASISYNYAVNSTKGSKNQTKTSHGFLTMNTDLTPINSSMTENSMQKATTDEIVDSGGNEGDMGSVIPVGDGWIFMFMMALGYGVLKGLKSLKSLRV